ncbi:MAG: DUF1684 domain-containing protein [Bacteroidia bacterium]|nr:DUF1684 domain-containing protein [Bacteroidia bacterium]
MKCILKFFILSIVTLSLTNISPILAQTGTEDYISRIEAQRQQKDSLFADSTAHGPLSEADRAGFDGLRYFAIDPQYRVTARLVRNTKPTERKMATSDHRSRSYRVFGELHFSLGGQNCHLTIYEPLQPIPGYPKHLFLPFTDQTSGQESYGGGRYLDLTIPKSDTLELDFNRAYNPYCAYSPAYSCPIPPRQNRLPIAVRAGEKIYEEEDH